MLQDNQVKEHLALAYVYAVAARARCAFDPPRVDMDSIDIKLSCRNDDDVDAPLRSPELALQVKAHVMDAPVGESFSYFLKLKNHHDLVKRTAVPRLLVVVTLPNEPEEWLSFSPEQLVLKRCAYWLNLFGRSPTQNKSGETVQLLRAQTFDPGTLSDLMRKAARQELQR